MSNGQIKRYIDAKIRDDGGPSRTFLSIYFAHKDSDILPSNDKSPLTLNVNGQRYVGKISLFTSHPPYLLTWLEGPKGRVKCTDVFLENGWNNGSIVRFEVARPRQELQYLKTVSAGSQLPKRNAQTHSPPKPRRIKAPAPISAPAAKNFDRATIEVEAKNYWHLIKDADKTVELVFDRDFKKARELGYLDRDLFVRVGVWKSSRNRSRLENNSATTIKKRTQQAFLAPSKADAIRLLCTLDGVATRTAIAMLHWMMPDEFPMLDVRVVRALGLDEPSDWEDLNFYEAFAEQIMGLARQLEVDLRTLDRALWSIDLRS